MHRCLYVPEMVSTICWKLDSSQRAKTLAALACTCKAFEDPALDALYYEIRTLAHLCMSMPEDLWVMERKTITVGSRSMSRTAFMFRRAMLRKDWRILEKYVRRVRKLVLQGLERSDRDTIIVDPDVLSAISAHCGLSLFPQLRQVHVSGSMHLPLPLLSKLCLGPTLECLKLEELEPRFLNLITLASQSSPMLKALQIIPDKTKSCDQLPVLLLDAAEGFKKLQHLMISLRGCDPQSKNDILSAVRSLHSLRSVALHIAANSIPQHRAHIPPPASISAPTISLPGLVHLQLTGLPMQVEELLQEFDLSTITSFGAGLERLVGANEVEEAVASLTPRLPEHLQNWELGLADFRFLEQAEKNLLQPLSRFRNLTEVTLRSTVAPFTDEMVAAITFPRLQRLHLRGHGHHQAHQTTFRGLTALLRRCPRLVHLTLAINAKATANPPCSTCPAEYYSATLTSWDVTGSLIDDPEFTVHYVASLMPRLREIITSRDDVKKSEELWTKVDNLLEFWRAVSMRW